MPRRPQRRARPFVDQSLNERRSQFVSVGWRIRQDPNGKGLFTSPHMLPGGRYQGEILCPDEPSSHARFLFLSERHAKQGFLFHAQAHHVMSEAVRWVEAHMHDRIRTTLTAEEHALAYPEIRWKRMDNGVMEMDRDPVAVFDRLGSVTRYGLYARHLREALDLLPPISLGARLDRNYTVGIGAHFTVDEATVNLDAIERTIQDFRRRGEVEFISRQIERDDPVWGPRIRQTIEEQASFWDEVERKEKQGQRGLF